MNEPLYKLMGWIAAVLQRRPWCLWQHCGQWRNWEPSAAQEAEQGDSNLLGIKMRGGDFPRSTKCLFSNWIWKGSPGLQGGFKNSNLSFHKCVWERFSIFSHLATAQRCPDKTEESSSQLHFFYPRNNFIVQHECQGPGSFWALHVFARGCLSCVICPDCSC